MPHGHIFLLGTVGVIPVSFHLEFLVPRALAKKKSFLRAGVVQILTASTSKSAPTLSVFNDFDFQIALARRRGANFGDFNFQKCSDAVSF